MIHRRATGRDRPAASARPSRAGRAFHPDRLPREPSTPARPERALHGDRGSLGVMSSDIVADHTRHGPRRLPDLGYAGWRPALRRCPIPEGEGVPGGRAERRLGRRAPETAFCPRSARPVRRRHGVGGGPAPERRWCLCARGLPDRPARPYTQLERRLPIIAGHVSSRSPTPSCMPRWLAAIRDPLTGLFNRRYLDAALERLAGRTQIGSTLSAGRSRRSCST